VSRRPAGGGAAHRWRRGFTIAWRLVPFVVAFLRDRHRFVLFGRERTTPPAVHARRARRLAASLAALGPTFIKLAQLFSARADILPEPYLSAVGELQDHVPPDPFPAIAEVLEAELGAPIDAVFTSFEREPVAAASLGQVHAATLGAERVAVKVLRPNVQALVAVDLEISFRLLFLLNVFFPNHHVRALTNVVREFSVRVREEMDFREEAAHMELFHRHFATDRRVRAPRVKEGYTRRRVLVMEWVEGDKVSRLGDRFASGELSLTRLMDTLTEIYLRMMLVAGFLHADPHPGNIVVERNGTIVFLDWGMVVQFASTTRDAILRLGLAAARGEGDAMINGMYELGMIDPGISRAEIRDAAAEIVDIVERSRELGPRRAQEMVREIMDTFYTWPLILPRELVYFFRAAALLEGIGLSYDPGFDGMQAWRPVAARMRPQLLRAVAPEPAELARNIFDEVRTGFAALRDIVRRAEREEFRVRVHPQDIIQAERFMLLQVRRILLALFAVTTGLITAIIFLALRNVWVLLGGLVIALFMFLITLVIPTHLLENPMRHARGLRPPDVP
jgi:predicted unusual protein kinase regulating ubiquinone biosynthesis (AarF/ABC1/UbiB family)